MKKVLIVDGNNTTGNLNIEKFKGLTYVPLFTKAINKCGEYEIDAMYPTHEDFIMPSIEQLQSYDGILWTGSSLSVNETPEYVDPQIKLCALCFESKTPIYGSCWGLQVAVKTAGGKVSSSKKGYEIGIMKNLDLTPEGEKHFLFKNKKTPISSFCVHKDYIEQIPANSTLLASNSFCPVQALEIRYKGGTFIGVQYHPEFDNNQMFSTYERLKDMLYKSEYFKNTQDYEKEVTYVKDKIEKNIDAFYNDEVYRILEIKNWLDSL